MRRLTTYFSAMKPADVSARESKDVVQASVRRRGIRAAPNPYFHATTAYDVLRSKGVAKRNYMGRLRLKS